MTTPDPAISDQSPSQAAQLLGQQVELLERLASLTDSQAALVEAGDADPLISVLAHRQQLIAALDRVKADLQPFRRRWSQLRQRCGESDRQTIDALSNRSGQLLSTIIEADDRDRLRLEQAHQQLGQELSRLNRTGAARRAYTGRAMTGPSRFTDQQG